MNCGHCRGKNPDEASHCLQCGAELRPGVGFSPTLADGPRSSPAVGSESPTVGIAEDGPPSPNGSGPPSRALAADSCLEPGAELGTRYKVVSLLGKGGMGAVYKAHDKELDRTVALKLIRPDLASQSQAMQRFKQELLLASKVSHRNILRIHDLVDVDGTKFISMAHIDGEDLHSLLGRQGRLPLDQFVSIARQLCAALEAAHSEGIIHRDLKPENVLVDQEGNAYISDFGLAKSLEAGAAKVTQTGQVLGTPRYMSPEQVQGVQADRRSDLYSLGLILYEMATGEVPFASDSLYQTMFMRTKDRPKDPRLLNPELPDPLARIILRCLERDPARRYQSARDILLDLEAERAPVQKLRLPLPRLPRKRWIAGAGLGLLLATIVWSLPHARRLMVSGFSETIAKAGGTASPAERKYVALLPFRVLGDKSSLGYIAEGLNEALTARLFQLSEVYIPSLPEAERASKKESLEKIARDLGVKIIVQGTVTGDGDKIAVTVNLDDVKSGRREWAKEFSGMRQDLLTLQDRIYNDLLVALQLTPDNEERARAATHSTEDIEAYDLYLKGRNALRGEQDVGNLKAAIGYFEKALTKDAGFALAYVGLSDSSLAMYRETKDSLWAQKALAAGEQGRRLNDQLPEVYLTLGNVYNSTGRSSEAVAVLKRALELAPNSDEGYRRLGAVYLAGGRSDEAIKAYERAAEINPYFWLNFNALGDAHFRIGNFDAAFKAFRRVSELEPDNIYGPLNIGAVLFSQGKYDECIPAFQKALAIKPSWQIFSNLGTAYFYLKRYREAVGMFEKAVDMNPNQEVVVGNLADAYRWSGDPQKARSTYDRAIDLAYKDLEVNPRKAVTMSSLALYYAKEGKSTRALDFIRRARSIDESNVEIIYGEAVVQALAGQDREALMSLRQAFEKGYAVEDALANPELAKFQDLPEFKALLADFSKNGSKQD
jgi:serine/threonine protein kinase/tetratricopeptide (TPR) repeat protein